MTDSYDLSKLGPEAFENIVNFLALKTLGLGNTGFGPGADGGRDGYFEGEAPYPSETFRWKGVWYIQSKFHKPHLSTNPQKWIIDQVKKEIEAFDEDESDRIWPDNWIIVTNIDPSGKPETGSFDAIKKLLKKSPNGKKVNIHVWGGRKILDLLALHGDVAKYYGHFLTPGHVISALYDRLTESRASLKDIIRYFVVNQFSDNIFTKLDQAGSSSDVRPGVHDLFIDLPFRSQTGTQGSGLLSELCYAAAQCHRYSLRTEFPETYCEWNKNFRRARVSLIKGGPGQGKSTVGQYLCQIHRAKLILGNDAPYVLENIKNVAKEINNAATQNGFWPTSPRIPIQVELKEYAHWYSQCKPEQPNNILVYITEIITKKIGEPVLVKTLKNALANQSWIVVFDGLDEVPNDFKDKVANEVLYFLNDILVEINADVLAICSSRPQGYSGQFAGIDGPIVELSHLDTDSAMRCATPVLKFGRSAEESEKSIEILETAIKSPNVRELMTTPLQSHIMAVVVRDGGRPPERRWQLFNSFYLVMKKRESLKNFQNPRIAKLLREEDRLLKSVHMRLGFVLHARAERSEGAQTTLSKTEFRNLVHDVVTVLDDHDIEQTVADVMEATTQRLVLVNTPENGEQVRFDIRQLQEFFAAEFLYDGVDTNQLETRIETISGDAHWREVMHFLLSALIENRRTAEVAVAVQALRRLNEGEEGNLNRIYYRRMAKATLLASRVLIEGVLEQDQRDRQQLKPLFDPLGGVLDLSSLFELGHINLAKSKKWLIQSLLDTINTAIPRETLGALFLLGWLLPDDSEDLEAVCMAFQRTSILQQEYLYSLWASHRDRLLVYRRKSRLHRSVSVKNTSQWVLCSTIHIFNSNNWINYSTGSIRTILRFLCNDQSRFISSFETIGINSNCAKAIFQCLKIDEMEINEKDIEPVDCGFLTAYPFPENWVNGKFPDYFNDFDFNNFVKHSNGLFKLIFICLWLAKERSSSALNEFVKFVDCIGSEKLGVLPDSLLALLPIPGRYSETPFSIDHLRNIDTTTSNWLNTLTAEQVNRQQYWQIRDVRGIDKNKSPTDQWRLFSVRLPRIALDFAINPVRLQQFVQVPKQISELDISEFSDLISNSHIDARHHILYWGNLKNSQAELLTILKNRVSSTSLKQDAFWIDYDEKISPFELDIPEDIHLLSVLAPALVNWYRVSRQFNFRWESSKSRELYFHNALAGYCLSLEKLRNIAESDNYKQDDKAGALALYWLLLSETETPTMGAFEITLDLNREKELYEKLANEFNEEWLAHALIGGVLIRRSETDPDALCFVTYLMNRCVDGGGARNAIIELIENWRERSTAPVNSKRVLESWLGYDFNIPTYAI